MNNIDITKNLPIHKLNPKKITDPFIFSIVNFINYLLDQIDNICKLHYYSKDNCNYSFKSDNSKVTKIDILIENIIIKSIKNNFPSHFILSEENYNIDDDCNKNKYQWIIDPIDGTENFIKKIPYFTNLITFIIDNITEISVINNPILNERYIAIGDNHCYLNGNNIYNNISQNKLTKNKLIIRTTDLKYFNKDDLLIIDKIKNIANSNIIFENGDTYLFAMLANNYNTDIIVEKSLNIWDLAPAINIVKNSGAIITDIYGSNIDRYHNDFIIASNNYNLHNKILLNI